MSGTLSLEEILFRQRLLSCSGVYSRKLDGLWGFFTDEADAEFNSKCNSIAQAVASFDPRSERNIRSLRLDAQQLCRESLQSVRSSALDARVISGTRSYAQQAALYRQGRNGNPGPKVTNAGAGQSWHNFGLAWDIGIFRNGEYLTDGHEYDDVSKLGRIAGVEWGGDWHSFKDKPHYQCPFGAASIDVARARFENGGRA